LPGQPDHSDGPGTLPAAELNPLLNPVLGQNMGRWAEVYFTSPPEKREQAVLELLRELRAENPGIAGEVVSTPSAAFDPASQSLNVAAPQIAETPQPVVPCRSCGRENPASHRFCGMCGKLLGEAASADLTVADLHVTDIHAPDLHATDLQITDLQMADRQAANRNAAPSQTTGFHISDLHIEDENVADQRNEGHQIQDRQMQSRENQDHPQAEPAAPPQKHETQSSSAREAVYEPVLNTSELSLFQRGGESGYSDGQSDEMFLDSPAPRPYRIYVGIALAVVISALGFMAWRSTQAASKNSRVEPQAPPVVAAQPAEATPETNALKADTPSRSAAANQPAAAGSAVDQTSRNRSVGSGAGSDRTSEAAGRRNHPNSAARPAALSTPTATQNALTEAATGYGSEELAMAQRYLDGSDGQARNPAEAATWLWKAMAKHNAKAPLLLADLYLKGEGVSKNCDQARVLLDSATRAGVKDAAERLRHLQAFGCQ
jgi:hypothetical protein